MSPIFPLGDTWISDYCFSDNCDECADMDCDCTCHDGPELEDDEW